MQTQSKHFSSPDIGAGVGIGGPSVAASRANMAGGPTHQTAGGGCNVHTAHSFDPEYEDARDNGEHWNPLTQFLVFALFKLLFWRSELRHWLKWKHVCAWCKPMRRMSGNPFAKHSTHGICPRCRADWDRQMAAIELQPH